MKVVVGLGNPGIKYTKTRHNVGFWVVDYLAERFQAPCTKERWKSLIGECRIGDEKVILCKPQTYMNLSGEAIHEITSFFGEINPEEDLIVIYDDMDFAAGTFRLREQGSAGGHNGVKSIIAHLGTHQFPRIRVGIGRPDVERTVIDHVLSPFPRTEEQQVHQAAQRAADAAEFAIMNSFTLAMNRFNGTEQ
jgi:PTH1 family peptidyl-tRNA hydrolase